VGGSNKEKTKWLCHFYFLGKPQQMYLRAGSPPTLGLPPFSRRSLVGGSNKAKKLKLLWNSFIMRFTASSELEPLTHNKKSRNKLRL